ncbi:MAG: methyl-accepting chemotaxis protein, partial [Rhodospirillaceae bacterium]|nr:methyl-accepting chemotaxis protein [Rhodospirillaceae bacterium]
MSIKARLVLVLAIILVVFSGASGITLLTLNKQTPKLDLTQSAAKKVDELSIPLLIAIKDLKMNVVQVQQWISDISATRGMDGLNDGFDEAKASADKFNENLNKARTIAGELNLQEVIMALDEVEKAFPPYYETGVKMGETYVAEGPAGGNVMMGSFDAVAEKMGVTLDKLIEEVEKATTERLVELRSLSAEVSEGNASIIKLNLILGVIGLVVALVGAIYLFVIIKSSIEALLADIGLLANQDYTGEKMLKADRKDEFGPVAVTIIDTCDKLQQVQEDEEKRKEQEQAMIEQRRKERMSMAEQFETSVGSVVEMVSAAATEMQSTAKGMSSTADMTSQQSSTVAAAAEEASTNVQTVASAAEEL